MKTLRLVNRVLVRIETVFLVLFLGAMVLLAFAQVVLRNVFGTGFLWGDPLVRQMVLWSGFVGAALAASQDRHISIDALTHFFSRRARHVVQIVTNLFAAAICSWLAQSALDFVREEQRAGSDWILGIPAWLSLSIIPIGYGLLALHFVLNIIDRAFRAFTPGADDAPAPEQVSEVQV